MGTMNCPLCNGASECIDSRHVKSDNTRYRRRRCKVCDERFTTKELVAEDLWGLQDNRKLWERLKSVSESRLTHWRQLLWEYRDRCQAENQRIASREIEHYDYVLREMQRLEAESGGKE